MKFIAKVTIKEKLSKEGMEVSMKNYNDSEYMSKLKAYQLTAFKQAFAFGDNFSIDIEYELKEEDE